MITVETLLANPELRKGAGWRGAVTHCRHGHEYTSRNTYRDQDGRRRCGECDRQKAAAYRRARAARC